MKSCILIFSKIVLIISPAILFSQNYQEYESPNIRIDPEWISTNRVVGFNWAYDVIADKEGNTYRTGYFKKALEIENEYIHPENRILGDLYFLIKSDSNGNIIWYSYAIGNSRPCKLNFDNNGNVYVVGSVFSKELIIKNSNSEEIKLEKPNNYNSGIFICKYDTSGKIVKSKFYSEGYSEFPKDFKIGTDNNLYIGGHYIYRSSDQPSHQKHSFLLLKLDSNWNKVWSHKGDTVGTATIGSLFPDYSGNLLVSGGYNKQLRIEEQIYHGHYSNTKPFIVKLYDNGKVQWVKDSFENITSGFGNAIVCDQKNNAYLWISTSHSKFHFIKLNKNGKLKWKQTARARMSNYLEKALIDNEGNVYLCGQGYGAQFPSRGNQHFSYKSVGSTDFFITRYNKKGELLWLKVGGGKSTDYCKSIALSGNNLYAFGWTGHQLKFNQKIADADGRKCFWMAKFDLLKLENINRESQQ